MSIVPTSIKASTIFTPCDKDCKCHALIQQLEEARNPEHWHLGAEYYSSEWLQDALDMQLNECKQIKNPFYC